jgi:hypothetical protein
MVASETALVKNNRKGAPMKTKLFNASLALLILVGASCTPNISSSELRDAEAQDLKVTAFVKEIDGEETVEFRSILRTIPDGIGVVFNEGQTLTARVEIADGLSPSEHLAYESNFFNIGEQYVTRVPKPDLGDDYILTYKDYNDVETTVRFSSEGVPSISRPLEEAELPVGGKIQVEWDSQDLGSVHVELTYPTGSGRTSTVTQSTADDGSFEIDPNKSPFRWGMSSGPGQISLIHYTDYNDMEGFGDASITIETRNSIDVNFVYP